MQKHLADETWEECPSYEVILSFLRSEWDKWPAFTVYCDRIIIEAGADLSNAMGNNVRAMLLWQMRGPLLSQIPPDTRWFRVRHLSRSHIQQLRAINYYDWISPEDHNELEKVAIRKAGLWRADTGTNWEPILWGHDRHGPFTILEGNHRMTALAAGAQQSFNLTAYVGLSPNKCIWHLVDGIPLPR